MSLAIYVDAYSGYKPNERPRQFVLDEVVCEIDAVLDQVVRAVSDLLQSAEHRREDLFAPIR